MKDLKVNFAFLIIKNLSNLKYYKFYDYLGKLSGMFIEINSIYQV